MMLNLRTAMAVSALLIAMSWGGTAFAQKHGGVLKMYSTDSPARMSILEESTPIAPARIVVASAAPSSLIRAQ